MMHVDLPVGEDGHYPVSSLIRSVPTAFDIDDSTGTQCSAVRRRPCMACHRSGYPISPSHTAPPGPPLMRLGQSGSDENKPFN